MGKLRKQNCQKVTFTAALLLHATISKAVVFFLGWCISLLKFLFNVIFILRLFEFLDVVFIRATFQRAHMIHK